MGVMAIQMFLFVPQQAWGNSTHAAWKGALFLQTVLLQQVVSQKTDEQPVTKQATQLQSIVFHDNKLTILADGEFKKFEVYELTNPPRLAVDVFEVQSNLRLPSRHPQLKSIRQGKHEDKIRIVLDLHEAPASWTMDRLPSGMALTFTTHTQKTNDTPSTPKPSPNMQADKNRRKPENPPVEIVSKSSELPKKTLQTALLKDIRFIEAAAGGEIEIVLSKASPWKITRPDARSAILTVNNVHLPEVFEQTLDLSVYKTPLKKVETFKEEEGIQIVVSSEVEFKEVARKTKKGLSWKFLTPRALVQERKTEVAAASQTLVQGPVYNDLEAPEKFSGKRVSFEFKDIGIHNLLRMISEVAQKNIVVADDVQGKVTIRLKNVPWEQALELVLRSKSLGKETLGNNIIRVAPLRVLEEEARMREERARTLVRQEPLVIQLIPVSYANAEQLRERVREMLTERGTVSVDARTNTLIVREVASNMDRTRSLVSSLDTQTPQVLIESRIVEANTNYTKEFGIQWGGHAALSPATGNATGVTFPNTISMGGAAGDTPNAGTSSTPQYAVNLPVAVGAGSGGGLGFVFGSAGGAFQLNLRLSALETQGHVKTISAPKVTTMDNSTARISQGISLPFSQVSASGVNTSFIEARLSLEVTPHITADGSVLMNIRAENNQPDPSNTGANGQPAIQRKEATTQVLVRDSETTVIGGIYVRRGSSNSASVPGLSRIPILGHLFKNHRETEVRQELLIFITPRILNKKPTIQNI